MQPVSADPEPDPESTSEPRRRSPQPLICRTSRDIIGLVIVFLVCGLIFQGAMFGTAPQPHLWCDPLLWGSAAVIFYIPCLVMLWARWHRRIIADAYGLTLVGMFSRRFVTWSAISDFYFQLPKERKATQDRAILEIKGKRQQLSWLYDDFDTLLRYIEREARWSKTRKFERYETRDIGAWPKKFRYIDESGWKIFFIYLGFSALMLLQIVIKGIDHGIANFANNFLMIWNELSLAGKAGMVLMLWFTCGSLGLVFVAQYPAILTRRRWLGREVIATRDDLAFRGENDERSVRWSEIESYHLEALPGNFQPDLCVVQSRGERFEFLSNISQARELRTLITDKATNSITHEWRHAAGHDEEDLGAPSLVLRSGSARIDVLHHHYHTRTNRAVLVLGSFLSLTICAPLVFGGRMENGQWHDTRLSDLVMMGIFGTCIIVPTVLGWWGWFRSYLEADENGITQHSLWGIRHLAWSEVKSLVFNGYWYRVKGTQTNIRFGSVASGDELRSQIEIHTDLKWKRDGNAF